MLGKIEAACARSFKVLTVVHVRIRRETAGLMKSQPSCILVLVSFLGGCSHRTLQFDIGGATSQTRCVGVPRNLRLFPTRKLRAKMEFPRWIQFRTRLRWRDRHFVNGCLTHLPLRSVLVVQEHTQYWAVEIGSALPCTVSLELEASAGDGYQKRCVASPAL
jgi:hypothetical protein